MATTTVVPSKLPRREATAALLAQAQEASAEDRASLQDEVIRINMPVASDAARRYRGRGIAVDDLEQVAYLGLVKAVRRFEPDRPSDFLSYAVPTIRGELRRHFRDFGWVVRPPRSVQELQARLTAADADLCQQLGRAPRPQELAEHLGVDLRLVLDSQAAAGCFTPTSLDTPAGDGDGGLIDWLGGEDSGFSSAEARVALAPLVAGLDERERLILEMRFVRGCTQAEIGVAVGVTQMQVSRLITALLARLRRELGSEAA
ncbi:sigma-70 family RNA polymerase sigma factor [Nocardioides sp.]|uniref:sigma-70 family RNA polymerase sigma factor n=1 Tax=Nocardioides sp. TaxID=35761 RepID=UPI003D139FBC